MAEDLDRHFFQKHPNGLQVEQRGLTLLIIRVINVNQNHSETSHHTLLWKREEIKSLGEDVEKRKISSTIGGNINWCSHYGKHYGGSSKKLKIIKPPYDPAIPLWEII